MDGIELRVTSQTELRIDGFPNAEKLVRLDGDEGAKWFADLALHRYDLEFASQCINAISAFPSEGVVREALWRSAIVHLFKCFGRSKSRQRLAAIEVYQREPEVALEVFGYYKALRNKFIVHDENAYMNCLAGAVVNREGATPYKIEKLITMSTSAGTLDQQGLRNMQLLVDTALRWVGAEYEKAADDITAKLEKLTHAELLAREPPQYRVAKAEDVATPR